MLTRTQWGIVALGVVLDQITKYWASQVLSFSNSIVLVTDRVSFDLVHNYGAAYGILQGYRWPLLLVSVLVVLGCIFFARYFITSRWSYYGLCFVLIGAMGNGIDRFVFGYVVDFINIRIFPVFNLADVAIDIGVALFATEMIRDYVRSRRSRS